MLRRPAREEKAGRKAAGPVSSYVASLSLSTPPRPTLVDRDTHGLLEYTVRTTPDSDSTRLSPRAEAATRAFEYVSKERRKRSLADRSLQTSVTESVSQSLPHSYQRSTWSLHTLIFYTSVRWILCILWFLLAGLALQVDSPSSGSSFRTSRLQADLLLQVGRPFVLQVGSCFRIVFPSLFTYLPSAQILMRTDLR